MNGDIFGQLFALGVGAGIGLWSLREFYFDKKLQSQLENELPLVQEGSAILGAEPSFAKTLGQKYLSMVNPTLERISPIVSGNPCYDENLRKLCFDYDSSARTLKQRLSGFIG